MLFHYLKNEVYKDLGSPLGCTGWVPCNYPREGSLGILAIHISLATHHMHDLWQGENGTQRELWYQGDFRKVTA